MGISAFPQGSLERERPPQKGGGNSVSASVTQLPPPLCRTSGQKGGVAPSIFSPLVRRAVCRTRGLGAARRDAHRGKQYLPRSSLSTGFRQRPNYSGEGFAL